MKKSKAGRKPLGDKKKIARTITMDSDLPAAVEKVTPNLSGYMNDATWEKLKRAKNKPGHFRDTDSRSGKSK